MRKLTRELHAVQNELYRELSEEDGSRRQHSALRQAPACDDLKGLQTAADQLRRVLWFYLDLASHQQTDESESATPGWLVPEPQREIAMSDQQQKSAEAGSFFERLNLVIDGYMQDRGVSRNTKKIKS